MKTILIGTTNKGKITEFCTLINPLPVQITTPVLLGTNLDIAETGTTFEENALLKATTWAETTNLATLVDDSGLIVDALGGKPGVLSNRFYPGSDSDRNNHILKLLNKTAKDKRTARYVCALAFFDPATKTKQLTVGIFEGTIAFQSLGSQGFGYDPIFMPKGYNVSLGELSIEIKNKISHRRQALAKMLPYLQQWCHE